jgi:hypothetical protein
MNDPYEVTLTLTAEKKGSVRYDDPRPEAPRVNIYVPKEALGDAPYPTALRLTLTPGA